MIDDVCTRHILGPIVHVVERSCGLRVDSSAPSILYGNWLLVDAQISFRDGQRSMQAKRRVAYDTPSAPPREAYCRVFRRQSGSAPVVVKPSSEHLSPSGLLP